MRRAGKMSLAALLFMTAMRAGSVQAQPAPAAPTASPGATATPAEALFREGNALAAQQRWVEAEAKFRAAWALNPSYDIAANLGQVEFRLKKYRDAAEHLELAVRTWGVTGNLEPKERAKKRLQEARNAISSLYVKVSVEGAIVLVDGREIGRSPIDHELFVEPGTRTIEARLDGHDTAKQVVTAVMGEAIQVELAPTLTRVAAAVGEPKREGAAGRAQPTAAARSWVPVIVLGAASVVALGIGIGTTVASNNASDEAHAQRDTILDAGGRCVKPPSDLVAPCAEFDRSTSHSDTFRDAAGVAYIASGALALAAVTYALWPRATQTTSGRLRALPELRANGAGFSVLGAW